MRHKIEKMQNSIWKFFLIMIFFLCVVEVLLHGTVSMASMKANTRKVILEGNCGKYVSSDPDEDFYYFNSASVKFVLYEDGTMVVSGTGEMENYNDFDDDCAKYRIKDEMPWYKYRDKIKKLVFEEGVTSIGENNFLKCVNLEEIQWATTIAAVHNEAFFGCVSLKEVHLPSHISSWGSRVFSGCKGLTKVTMDSDFQFQYDLEYAYSDGLYMFENCSSLETVLLADGLKSIPACFLAGCKKITSFNLPEAVEYWGSYPSSLCGKEFVLPDSVKVLDGGGFADCALLEKLILPDGLLTIGPAFSGCRNLKTIEIPGSVTSLGDGAFGRSGLISIVIPETVKNCGEELFEYCENLKSVTFLNSFKGIPTRMFIGCKNLEKVKLPDSVTKIGKEAFLGCSGLKKIVLPDKVREFGIQAFQDCKSLKTVVWNPKKKSKCYFFSQVFTGCGELREFTIPRNTVVVGDIFGGCKKVKVTVLCNSSLLKEAFFLNNNFPQTATILVPKGKLQEFKEVFQKFEGNSYKINVRELA